MADRLNPFEGLEFLFGSSLAVGVGSLQIAVDDFDGLEQSAGGLGFPDFAEATAADAVYELIAGNRLRTWFDPQRRHDSYSDPPMIQCTRCLRSASPIWEISI